MTIHGSTARGACDICGRARLAPDADVDTLPNDPVRLKFLIGELQFENGLLRGIIEVGGGASALLRRGGRI